MAEDTFASSDSRVQRQLGFIHRFVRPSAKASDINNTNNDANTRNTKNSRTLLLLHGTGGDEDDLLSLGRQIDPNAALLSPRGKVLESGSIPRFFRRLAEGVFDLEDLKFRTNELADFVEKASEVYEFDRKKIIAVGYSNGANIAASILLVRPHTLFGAILFRAMVPLVPDSLPNLSRKSVFMSSGLEDPIATKHEAETLCRLLQEAGANVTLRWQDSGHALIEDDIQEARKWYLEIEG